MASLPKRGRPRLKVQMHRIGIRMDVYDEWVRQKDLAGMTEQTHSEFATYLLRNLSEARQQSSPISSHGKLSSLRIIDLILIFSIVR